MWFVKFLADADAQVVIPAVPAPKSKFSTAAEAVKLSLNWELEVTRQINALVAMAKKENDYTTDTFLQWFVREQLEEVSSMDQLLKVIQRAGEDNLLRIEEYLARKPASGGGESEAQAMQQAPRKRYSVGRRVRLWMWPSSFGIVSSSRSIPR